MPIPGQSLAVNENGAGVVTPATNIPLFIGYSTLGTANVMKTYNSIPDLVAGEGQGQAVEDAAYDLAFTGGPIRFMKTSTSVAGTLSAVAKSGAGPTVTVAGATPADDYQAILRIRGGGVLGTATFDYSLDNGVTYSETLTVPAGGTYSIPQTGVTATFPAGTYVAAETYTFTTTAPMWNSSDLSAAFTAITNDSTGWDFIVCSGRQATGAAAATLAAALQTQLVTLANNYRYKRGIIDGGDEAYAAILTAFASTVANRTLVSYRGAVYSTPKPFPGWGSPKARLVRGVAQKAHDALISTDLARVKSGPLSSVASIEHDEQKTEVLDVAKITTARTIPGLTGFFITNARLKSAAGSDFQYWQHGRIMDVACATVYSEQAKWLSAGIRTNPDGTVDERDAQAIETAVTNALNAQLIQPTNAEGTRGHVSRLQYTINRLTNFQSTGIMLSELAIQPFGYIKRFTTTLGLVASFPQPAAA